MANEKGKKIGNKVIIGDKENRYYVDALVKALQPFNYEREQKVIVSATESRLGKAEAIVSLFTSLWIEVEKKEKTRREIEPDSGGNTYTIPVVEITLKKHPKLR